MDTKDGGGEGRQWMCELIVWLPHVRVFSNLSEKFSLITRTNFHNLEFPSTVVPNFLYLTKKLQLKGQYMNRYSAKLLGDS